MSSNLPQMPAPYQPNAEGATLCTVRWMIDTPAGWIGAYDKEALLAYGKACAAAECADAERYRWLRDVGDATWRPFALRAGYSAATADAEIDAAIRARGET